MREGIRIKGHYEIVAKDVKSGRIEVYSLDNQITTAYQRSVLNSLCGLPATNLQIKYIALGTSDAPATKNDARLGNEIFRRQPTRQIIREEDGCVITTLVLLPADAVGRLREIGVFVGDASSVVDTGTLISRMNIDIEKTSSVELSIVRYDYVRI